MNDTTGLLRALETSLDMENKGYDFYMKVAGRSKNGLVRKLFKALAEDENRHKKAIVEYCVALAKKEKAPGLCAVMPAHKDIRERVIFGTSEAERTYTEGTMQTWISAMVQPNYWRVLSTDVWGITQFPEVSQADTVRVGNVISFTLTVAIAYRT